MRWLGWYSSGPDTVLHSSHSTCISVRLLFIPTSTLRDLSGFGSPWLIFNKQICSKFIKKKKKSQESRSVRRIRNSQEGMLAYEMIQDRLNVFTFLHSLINRAEDHKSLCTTHLNIHFLKAYPHKAHDDLRNCLIHFIHAITQHSNLIYLWR